MGIPVLFIRGTKGSGKTKFIEESLINGDFGDVGKALVLKLENGEAEYDEAKLSGKNAFVSSILNLNDFTEKVITEQVKKYRPQVIFIEANEAWGFDDIKMPKYFDLQQTITIISGEKFNEELNAMRQLYQNMISASEFVIINRCKPVEATSQMKRNVKLMNNRCIAIALDKDGKQLKLDSDLPFDVKGEKIVLTPRDFGIWYIDTFESKERYDNKLIEFDCMAVFSKKLPPKTFVAGRFAMTCCANDIQLLGHLLSYKGDIKLKNKAWVHVLARIHYMRFRGAQDEQVVLEGLDVKEIPAPSGEDEVLNLV